MVAECVCGRSLRTRSGACPHALDLTAQSESARPQKHSVFFLFSGAVCVSLSLLPARTHSFPMAGEPEFVKAARHPVLDAGYKVCVEAAGRTKRRRGGMGAALRRRARWCAPHAAPSPSGDRPLSKPGAPCAAGQVERHNSVRAPAGAQPNTERRAPLEKENTDSSSLSLLSSSSSCGATRSTSRSCWAAPWSASGCVVCGETVKERGDAPARPTRKTHPHLFPQPTARRLRHQQPVEEKQRGQAVRRLPGGWGDRRRNGRGRVKRV